MKTSIIAPVGMSPPIITEFVEYIAKVEGKFVSDVVLLVTDTKEVKECAELAVSALEVNYNNIHTHWVELPFSDISSTEDHANFMKICLNCIKKERIEHGCDYLYLNIAGGRKDMCASLVLLGSWENVDGIFHVICPEINVFNTKLERMRKDIEEHYRAENLTEFYRKHKEEFNELMFPPPESYNVIRIPYFPFPKKELGKIIDLLRIGKPINIIDAEMDRISLKRLENAGLIRMSGKTIYPTNLGLNVSKIWE
ncbi:MAG: CRISPR-associated protein Csx14 [Thermoplasmatales archaeon]|nr:CRISPR-associated protein Csx14 [Thermoplasmatales archaeon]